MTASIKIPCEVFSRVCGYFRPLQNWNKGKAEEFEQRRPYTPPKGVLLCSCGGEIHELSVIRAVCTDCGAEVES